MFTSDPLALGVVLLILGIGAMAFVRLAAVWAARRQPPNPTPEAGPVVSLDLEPSENAVIVTQGGGRLVYVNHLARTWFNLNGDDSDLDQLARRARPTELFLELCAAEGQARLIVGDHPVEASSHRVPLGTNPGMVLVLRPVSPQRTTESVTAQTDETFRAISEISQYITGNQGLEETVQVVLEGVGRLIPADIVEITLLDEASGDLVPYRAGTSRSIGIEIVSESDIYRPGEGYTGWLVENRKPLLIPDVDQRLDVRPKVDRSRFPFNAYLGVPLAFAGKLLGTLEIANYQPNAYDRNTQAILEIIASQAAIAIHNTQLYKAQERRAAELAGLSDLAQAVSFLTDREELFSRLSHGIARLLAVEILGFLLYDEVSENLVGQIPFVGIPDPFVDRYYRLPSPPDSALAAIWQARDYWLSNDAANDPEVDALGLRPLTQAASIENSLIVPIISGGRRLGVIQAANKSDRQPFDEDDIRLLSILAGQSAALIENAQLVDDSRRRAERAEGLRRVTALASSAATPEEMLTYALRELARLVRADVAVLALLDQSRSELRPHLPSSIGVKPELLEKRLVIHADDPQFPKTVTCSQRPFISNQVDQEALPAEAYDELVEQVNAESLMDIPLVIHGTGIGEILLAKTQGEGFAPNDLQIATNIAGQVAGAVERARLSAHTDESLRRRVEQLTALVRVSRELNQTLDLEHLITQVHQEALRTTGAPCGSTVLFDLNVGTEIPAIAMIIGDHEGSDALSPLELGVVRSGGWRIVEDFNDEEEQPEHEGVRSALLTPIAYQGQTAGLIHLHGDQPYQFDDASAQITEALAIQAAIAIGTAQRYQEQLRRAELLRRRAEALSQIFQISNAVRTHQPLEVNLETIAFGLQAASGYNVVLISTYNPEMNHLRRLAAAGLPLATFDEMKRTPQPWGPVEDLLREEFRISQSFLIPYDRVPTDIPDLHRVVVMESGEPGPNAWHPEDLLLVPLYGMESQPVGLLSLDNPRTGLRPDRETIETIEIFANQAALAIENTLLYTKVESRVESLTRQLEDMRVAHDELSQSARELLLHDSEQSQAIEALHRRLNHAQALARVLEAVNAQTGLARLAEVLAREALDELGLKWVLIAEPKAPGLTITALAGAPLEGVNLDVLLGQHNPLSSAYRRGTAVVIPDIRGSADWAGSPLLRSLGAESALALPVSSDGEPVIIALMIGSLETTAFSEEDLDLYTGFANQLGAIIEHVRALQSVEQRLAEGNLLLDFSRQIGSLDLELVMRTLADGLRRAMPATDASLVALWQEERELLIPYGNAGFIMPEALEEAAFERGESLAGETFAAAKDILWDEIDFARDLNLRKDNLERYHRASGGRVPVSAMGVPLLAGEAVLGVIVLENYSTVGAFKEADATFVRSLARQAALIIQNARLFRAAEERARQLETLANVAATLTSSLDSSQIVQSLLIEFGLVLPYDSATLWLLQGNRLRVVAAQGFADDEDRIGLTVAIDDSALYAEMVEGKQPILVADTADDPRFPSFPDYPVHSWLGIPLVSRDEVVGLLALDNHEINAYQERHIEIATTLARQAAVALENAQLYEQTRQASEELEQRVIERTEDLAHERERAETLLLITSELSTSLDLDRVLNRALALVNDVIAADRGAILLIAPDSDQLIHRATLGGPEILPPGGKPSPYKRGEGLAGWVIENRHALIVPDLTADERWISWEDKSEEHKSALVVPLMVSEDSLGALMLLSHRRNAFNEDQLRLVSAAANQVAAAINNAELYRLIRDQAERLGGMLRDQQVEASKSRAILEAIADGVIVTDATHKIVLFNAAAVRILHLDREAALGRPAVEFIGLYGPAGRRWAEAMQTWSYEPPSPVEESFLADRMTLDDQRVVSVNLAPVVLGDEFLGSVSIFRDITRDVEVDRLKSEFVATVSHELRTPMTSIKGYVEVLLMGAAGELNDEQRRFLEIVKGNTDRLGILVNDLLDLSRIEAGRVNLSIQPLDLRELLEEAKSFVLRRSREHAKPIAVNLELAEPLPSVRGDPERVRQILTNLVDNSFNYTPSGGEISLRARQVGLEVEVEVVDNGIGISPVDRERIFERFYRGEQALTMGVAGTGLGLSIVLNLIEMHGGRIWVSSTGTPGEGSVFTFTLPILEGMPEVSRTQD